MADVRTTDFWEQRYREGRTGWDLGGPTSVFVQLLESKEAPQPGKILVVGCGKGHDVLLFARHGFDALGVDFAPYFEVERQDTPLQGELAGADLFGILRRK